MVTSGAKLAIRIVVFMFLEPLYSRPVALYEEAVQLEQSPRTSGTLPQDSVQPFVCLLLGMGTPEQGHNTIVNVTTNIANVGA
jgi:hypothetical protein